MATTTSEVIPPTAGDATTSNGPKTQSKPAKQPSNIAATPEVLTPNMKSTLSASANHSRSSTNKRPLNPTGNIAGDKVPNAQMMSEVSSKLSTSMNNACGFLNVSMVANVGSTLHASTSGILNLSASMNNAGGSLNVSMIANASSTLHSSTNGGSNLSASINGPILSASMNKGVLSSSMNANLNTSTSKRPSILEPNNQQATQQTQQSTNNRPKEKQEPTPSVATSQPPKPKLTPLTSPQRRITDRVRKWEYIGREVQKIAAEAQAQQTEGVAIDWRNFTTVKVLKNLLEKNDVKTKMQRDDQKESNMSDTTTAAPVSNTSPVIQKEKEQPNSQKDKSHPVEPKSDGQIRLEAQRKIEDVLASNSSLSEKVAAPTKFDEPRHPHHSPTRLRHNLTCHATTPIRVIRPLSKLPVAYATVPGKTAAAYAPPTILSGSQVNPGYITRAATYPLLTPLIPYASTTKGRTQMGKSNRQTLSHSLVTGAEISSIVKETRREMKRRQTQSNAARTTTKVPEGAEQSIIAENDRPKSSKSRHGEKSVDNDFVVPKTKTATHDRKPRARTENVINSAPRLAESTAIIPKTTPNMVSPYPLQSENLQKYSQLPRDFYEVLMSEKDASAYRHRQVPSQPSYQDACTAHASPFRPPSTTFEIIQAPRDSHFYMSEQERFARTFIDEEGLKKRQRKEITINRLRERDIMFRTTITA